MDKRYYRLEIAFIVVIVSGLFLASNYVQDNPIETGFLPFSILITVAFLMWGIFNKVGWRYLARIGVIELPDLNGEWSGGLDFYTGDDGKQSNRKVNIEVSIEQTFRGIKIEYKGVDKDTAENKDKTTKSFSVISGITNSSGEYYQLRYIFEKSNISYDKGGSGFAELDIDLKSSPLKMTGWWLADPRCPSGGQINLVRQSNKKLFLLGNA